MDLSVILPESRIAAMRTAGAWPDRLVIDYLDDGARRHPSKVLVTDYNGETGRSTVLTWADMERLTRRIALALIKFGIAPGDVVSFQLPNWWQFIALHLACVRAGAITNPLMPIFRERELAFMLDFAESKMVIAPKSFRNFDHRAMIEGLRPRLPALRHAFYIGVEGADEFAANFLDVELEAEGDAAALLDGRRPGANDVTQILYTSGTTGEPKGVMHTANTLFALLGPFAERLALGADDVVWMASPMAHQTGFMYGMLLPIMLGAETVIQDRWAAAAGAATIQRHGASFTMASTPFLADLLALETIDDYDLSSMRTFVSAGAPIPPALVERAKSRIGLEVVSGWGMSENGCVTTCLPGDPPEKVFGTDGRPLPGSRVKVAGAGGKPAAPGVEGPLKMQATSLFVGYLKRPELYGVDRDGWFDTGDLARMDDDGYIRITGRAKDIIIRGGENIPVVEIEDLLYRHPAVREVAIVGVPDDRLGERASAVVGLNEGATLSLEEIKRYLAERGTAKQYFPESLVIMSELPRTPSGKIQKFLLREALAEESRDPS